MPVRAEMLMGTTVTIDAPGADAAVIDRAFDWFHTVEQVCTRFDPESELCRLTMQRETAVAVSPLLFEAIRFALHIADVTEGAFDPTVGATMQRRGFDREHRTKATVPVMVEPGHTATYRDVVLDEEHLTVTLTRPLLLDLGAVAKGLAIDLAARELHSARNFAIDAGGDLYVGGVNSNGEPWSIGIRHPRQPGTCLTSVRVSDMAVCTSGDYEKPHHIVDPRTGSSPTQVSSATVIAPSAMLADAIATAALVLGPERGLALLEQLQLDGLLVTDALQMLPTAGWRNLSQGGLEGDGD